MKRFSQNLVSLFSADLSRRILGFISVAYLARILGKEEFGAISLGFAVLAYGMVLSSAGFNTLGAKRIAQGESPALIGQVFGSRAIATIVIITIIMSIVYFTVPESTTVGLIFLFLCSLLPQIIFLDWFFQGKETMGIVGIARTLQALLYMIVVLLFVRSMSDIFWVAGGSIVGEIGAASLLLYTFRRRYPGVTIRITPSFQLIKTSLPLAIGVIIASLVINYPPIALGIFSSKSNIGLYSAASKLVYFLLMADRILILLLIPASARKFQDSPETFSKMLQDTMKWIIVIGIPIAVGGMLIANELIDLIFGIEYHASAGVLKVLVWYFLLSLFHSMYSTGLIGAGGEKPYGKIMLITAGLYFFFVSIGAWAYGSYGAAFGVIIAEGCSVVIINRSLRSCVHIQPPKGIFSVILAAVVMAVGVHFVLPYGLLWGVLVGIGIYSIMVLILRPITRRDVELLLARIL